MTGPPNQAMQLTAGGSGKYDLGIMKDESSGALSRQPSLILLMDPRDSSNLRSGSMSRLASPFHSR